MPENVRPISTTSQQPFPGLGGYYSAIPSYPGPPQAMYSSAPPAGVYTYIASPYGGGYYPMQAAQLALPQVQPNAIGPVNGKQLQRAQQVYQQPFGQHAWDFLSGSFAVPGPGYVFAGGGGYVKAAETVRAPSVVVPVGGQRVASPVREVTTPVVTTPATVSKTPTSTTQGQQQQQTPQQQTARAPTPAPQVQQQQTTRVPTPQVQPQQHAQAVPRTLPSQVATPLQSSTAQSTSASNIALLANKPEPVSSPKQTLDRSVQTPSQPPVRISLLTPEPTQAKVESLPPSPVQKPASPPPEPPKPPHKRIPTIEELLPVIESIKAKIPPYQKDIIRYPNLKTLALYDLANHRVVVEAFKNEKHYELGHYCFRGVCSPDDKTIHVAVITESRFNTPKSSPEPETKRTRERKMALTPEALETIERKNSVDSLSLGTPPVSPTASRASSDLSAFSTASSILSDAGITRQFHVPFAQPSGLVDEVHEIDEVPMKEKISEIHETREVSIKEDIPEIHEVSIKEDVHEIHEVSIKEDVHDIHDVTMKETTPEIHEIDIAMKETIPEIHEIHIEEDSPVDQIKTDYSPSPSPSSPAASSFDDNGFGISDPFEKADSPPSRAPSETPSVEAGQTMGLPSPERTHSVKRSRSFDQPMQPHATSSEASSTFQVVEEEEVHQVMKKKPRCLEIDLGTKAMIDRYSVRKGSRYARPGWMEVNQRKKVKFASP
ncbi:hypothetical protein BJ508DRAFT_411001 [Ascobolus immersus RN42]|uniref:Uncharacterized protein n=1 Tax=Ascobolus immersus RN42 TaxID=1160509 RepID=A0A3N4IL03_ASCIM|nr:hypothetical protein BJ508DRAFT_411001 [Ascobolus immersus RN42]